MPPQKVEKYEVPFEVGVILVTKDEKKFDKNKILLFPFDKLVLIASP